MRIQRMENNNLDLPRTGDLQQIKFQHEAAAIRDGILEGYQDAINKRTTVFQGDLRSALKKAKK